MIVQRMERPKTRQGLSAQSEVTKGFRQRDQKEKKKRRRSERKVHQKTPVSTAEFERMIVEWEKKGMKRADAISRLSNYFEITNRKD